MQSAFQIIQKFPGAHLEGWLLTLSGCPLCQALGCPVQLQQEKLF